MGTAINHAAAIKRLEALFNEVKLDQKPTPEVHVQMESKINTKCDVHGKNGRRGSFGNVLHVTTRRDSMGNIINQKREPNFYHTAYFGNGIGPRRESMPALNNYGTYYRRRDSLGLPNVPPKKDMEHPSHFAATLRKDTLGSSTGSLRKDNNRTWGVRRDSIGGSMSCLKSNFLQVPNQIRRNSKNYSTDSLDGRRNSWDPGRRGSSGSSCWEEPLWETRK
ncbi:hypothetical protein BDFB_009899, partial [Asbolus verrucosus]